MSNNFFVIQGDAVQQNARTVGLRSTTSQLCDPALSSFRISAAG